MSPHPAQEEKPILNIPRAGEIHGKCIENTHTVLPEPSCGQAGRVQQTEMLLVGSNSAATKPQPALVAPFLVWPWKILEKGFGEISMGGFPMGAALVAASRMLLGLWGGLEEIPSEELVWGQGAAGEAGEHLPQQLLPLLFPNLGGFTPNQPPLGV